MFAIGAMGQPGADHVMTVLKTEFRSTPSQIGGDALHTSSRYMTITFSCPSKLKW